MIWVNGQEVVTEQYPGGETRFVVTHDMLHGVPAGYVEFSPRQIVTLRYDSDQDLFNLILLKDILDNANNTVPQVLRLKYVPYARMDRPHDGRYDFSLKSIADMLNWLNWDQVLLMDPHSDMSVGLIDHAVVWSCMDELLSRVWTDSPLNPDTTVLCFPDGSAAKKFERFVGKDTAYLVGQKRRNFDTGEIEGLDMMQPPSVELGTATNALIIDDLSSYGGTFVGATEGLAQYGIDNVFLAVAHCEESAWAKQLPRYIRHVYTTDSLAPAVEGASGWMTRYPQEELLPREQRLDYVL